MRFLPHHWGPFPPFSTKLWHWARCQDGACTMKPSCSSSGRRRRAESGRRACRRRRLQWMCLTDLQPIPLRCQIFTGTWHPVTESGTLLLYLTVHAIQTIDCSLSAQGECLCTDVPLFSGTKASRTSEMHCADLLLVHALLYAPIQFCHL